MLLVEDLVFENIILDQCLSSKQKMVYLPSPTHTLNMDSPWSEVKEKEERTHSDSLRNYQKEFITESTK